MVFQNIPWLDNCFRLSFRSSSRLSLSGPVIHLCTVEPRIVSAVAKIVVAGSHNIGEHFFYPSPLEVLRISARRATNFPFILYLPLDIFVTVKRSAAQSRKKSPLYGDRYSDLCICYSEKYIRNKYNIVMSIF